MSTKKKPLTKATVEEWLDCLGILTDELPTGLGPEFDDAIVGLSRGCQGDNNTPRLIYDAEKVIRITMKNDKVSYEDAIEWHDFNTFDAYVGGDTPIFINVFKRSKR